MLENNRNMYCGCKYNQKIMPKTVMPNYNCTCDLEEVNAAYGYNTDNDKLNNCIENNCDCGCNKNRMKREEMLKQIECLNFSIIELGLYLDTHIDDQRAIYLHRKYCTELRNLKNEYQKVYGPLSIYFPCNKWRWIEEPWPWEGGEY